MLPKTPAMTLGLSTLRRDDDTSIVDDDMTQDSQLVTMGQLREITD